MLAPAIAFVDVETTGTSPGGSRITEIAIVRVVDGVLVDEWSTLVNPGRSIPEAIQALTGITNDMVRDAPDFSQVRRDVMQRLEGCVFVAHNARFDYGFVKTELQRAGVSYTADVLCTVRLSRRLDPHAIGHNLDAIVARHGLEDTFDADPLRRAGRHSALGDARVLWRFVQGLYRERGAEEIEAAVKRLLRIPSLPPQLAPDALEGLPDGAGVYRFYGVNDLPIYVGKSVNLRDRIRSHFSSDYRSANDLRISSEIRRIEFEATVGELGALIREAQLVKQLLPLHNHRLRRKEGVCFISLDDFAAPPEIRTNSEIDWGERGMGAGPIYGPFNTRAQIRSTLEDLAAEHGLCWRLLGWEKRGGPCFARQVKRCRGACLGEETPAVHGLRLATALAHWKLRDWPFPGPAYIHEVDAAGGQEALHLFDRWCHLGTARREDEFESLLDSRRELVFDPDVYAILIKHWRAHPAALVPVSRERTAA
ncbi:exonuclease domain-containing protein [Usitatibacter palustris]|uniref:DNA-directed DNA polymerase n=1 Tax=Usitatibacter palustris TaxID=2732487 RepID=A0A6M4H8A0_9PROT|nr:exonuclease domain-containing protein [Usitatibacter palustris]QJR15836.1 3'-5' exonuclease DinG [Usitatibacter palustris]